MTQLEAPTEYKNILPKRVSHKHNQKPGWKTSGNDAGNVAKHNSESEVNVITIFGNCNVASRGIRGIQTATQQLPAHRKTSYQNLQSTSLAQWFNKYHAGLEVMGSIPMGDFHI